MRVGALSSAFRQLMCPRTSCRPATRIPSRPAQARMVVRVSTKEAERPEEDEDYQLRSDLKSVARTMLEGKPLLVEDAQEAQEEMERERFFGRIAVLGLGAVLIGERITGKGVVQALDHAVGVPLWEIEPLLGLLVLSLLWGALYPRKQLVPKAEGAQATERNWIADAQVLVRKLACVALAVAIVAETISGKGALALLDIETGVETLSEVEAGAAFLIMLFLTSAEPKPKRA